VFGESHSCTYDITYTCALVRTHDLHSSALVIAHDIPFAGSNKFSDAPSNIRADAWRYRFADLFPIGWANSVTYTVAIAGADAISNVFAFGGTDSSSNARNAITFGWANSFADSLSIFWSYTVAHSLSHRYADEYPNAAADGLHKQAVAGAIRSPNAITLARTNSESDVVAFARAFFCADA
jgi:hypothetical protein